MASDDAARPTRRRLGSSTHRSGEPRRTGAPVTIRLTASQNEALEAFIASQVDPKPSRTEAVHRALVDFLKGMGFIQHVDEAEGSNGSTDALDEAQEAEQRAQAKTDAGRITDIVRRTLEEDR